MGLMGSQLRSSYRYSRDRDKSSVRSSIGSQDFRRSSVEIRFNRHQGS